MDPVLLPGSRDVRGIVEEATTPGGSSTDALVVACPPHPQHGGSRSDQRLVAVSEALLEAGIDCLRFDYGMWDEGYGECEDVRAAIRWANDRYDRVGVFGYSFGASLALLATAESSPGAVDAVVALAPTNRLAANLDTVSAVGDISCPIAVIYGDRDSTVEWEPVVETVVSHGGETTAVPADHFFAGSHQRIADVCRSVFERTLLS